ncbi:alpha/beta hydrolase [Novosphingobium naphthalenivorans]|uniref:alpha/beta hydrolase n=1 Tax=Novosphingobium naphthalenivorans TaxID=273168 RepID=UPI0008341815|nr:alpha/beta hydrolase [Novosphingobium naphthalenivorans]
MSFEDLPPQVELVTEAGSRYAKAVISMSRPVFETADTALLDLRYGEDYYQKIDIYLPEGMDPIGLPSIVFAHGGSWIAGYKEWMAFMAPTIHQLPAIFVSISYRLAPAAKMPAPLKDCANAFRLAYSEIQRLGGDLDRIFVGGHSAGAHLTSLLALQPSLLVERGLPANAIKGCLAVSAPFDLCDNGSGNAFLATSRSNLLRDEADALSASPIALVGAGSPPFLITVGQNDFPFIVEQASAMARALEGAGIGCEFQDLADHDHFETNTRMVESGHPWLQAVKRIVDGK